MQNTSERLQVRVLGELRVSRDGVRMTLPPSKKTRALLGYLLLTGRSHRRERLCSLFWDVTDDPRGALRWSLSKLRPLIDSPSTQRVQATREAVGIELLGAEVDALEVRRAFAAGADLERMDVALLERFAGSFGGELLEGLDLPEFDEFQAFLVAEREELRRLRARILAALSTRLKGAPERALPYARSWALVDPLSLSARTTLLDLTVSTGRVDEAAQQYASTRRTFEELGSRDLAALDRAWQEIRSARTERPRGGEAPELSEPQRLSYTFLARPEQTQDAAEGEPEVIGRASELAWLRGALQGVVQTRNAKVLLIAGEPGIGKSHLLEYFAGWARDKGVRVMLGSAYESERDRPYGPLLDSLRTPPEVRVSGERESFLPQIRPGGALSGEHSKGTLFASATKFIEGRARRARALAVIIDDVHWLDPASAELLHYVARSASDAPILIVLSLRSEEAADNHALARLRRSLRRDRLLEERALAPLSPACVAALLSALGSDMDPERVAVQAGGNPLFAAELARVGELPDERVPESVSDAVRERLGRLTPEAADVLRWGAVLDGSFDLSDLAAVTSIPQEALVCALELLDAGALLRREVECDPERAPNLSADRYRFAHELVRRVVYAELSSPRRQLMHGRVARVLYARGDHGEEHMAQLTRHATLAQDHALAAEAYVAAGMRCRRLFAHEQAVSVARRGMRHAERLGGLESIRRMIELLEIELWCTAPEAAGPLTERIRALGEEALAEGASSHARKAHNVLSYWHFESGSLQAAEHHMLMAELGSRSAEPAEQLLSLAEAGRCLLLLGREPERARPMLAEAAREAERLRLEPAVLRDGYGLLHLFTDELPEAARCFEQAAALASAERNRLIEYHALEHRTLVELEREDLAAAQRFCGPLIEVARSLRAGSELPFAKTLAAACRYAEGDAAAAKTMREGLEELRVLGAKRRLMHALARIATIELQRGENERALAQARETFALAGELENRTEQYVALATAARAEQRLGRTQAHAETEAKLAELGNRGVSAAALRRMRKLESEERAAPARSRTQPRA